MKFQTLVKLFSLLSLTSSVYAQTEYAYVDHHGVDVFSISPTKTDEFSFDFSFSTDPYYGAAISVDVYSCSDVKLYYTNLAIYGTGYHSFDFWGNKDPNYAPCYVEVLSDVYAFEYSADITYSDRGSDYNDGGTSYSTSTPILASSGSDTIYGNIRREEVPHYFSTTLNPNQVLSISPTAQTHSLGANIKIALYTYDSSTSSYKLEKNVFNSSIINTTPTTLDTKTYTSTKTTATEFFIVVDNTSAYGNGYANEFEYAITFSK